MCCNAIKGWSNQQKFTEQMTEEQSSNQSGTIEISGSNVQSKQSSEEVTSTHQEKQDRYKSNELAVDIVQLQQIEEEVGQESISDSMSGKSEVSDFDNAIGSLG